MVEGGGVGFIPPLITPESYERLDAVSTGDVFGAARLIARTEDVWTGPSGGASIIAAAGGAYSATKTLIVSTRTPS